MPQYAFQEKTILLRESDDVAVARSPLSANDELEGAGHSLKLSSDTAAGHKIALHDIKVGDPIHKFGQIIGYASSNISKGDWVHNHNLHNGTVSLNYEVGVDLRKPTPLSAAEAARTFPGYSRPDGRVGTRNYVSLVSTVNCSASTVSMVVDKLRREALQDFPNVDDIVGVTHKTGCGMANSGPGYLALQRCLAGMADHPNVGASLIIGLGCEVNQALSMIQDQALISPQSIRAHKPSPPPILSIQQAGGVQKTVQAAFDYSLKLLKMANECKRTPQSIGGIVVGTNCGGSDGNSGITANPALGIAGDELIRYGGGWLIAETSETYGAEHLLTRRAVSKEVADKLVSLMRWWEEYTAMHGAEIDNNPAPGNKAGGLTTIFEKSLGAVAKSGSMPLEAVYDYAERIRHKGFTFMDTPGLDPVSVTGLVAGGCNLVAFTTGRGSCLGFKPSPVLKIATNSPLYERMTDDMDIDAGVILNGVSIETVAMQIFEELVEVAGGKKTKSEAQGLGDHEFAPWPLGAVL
ncbi:MAG: altronate dehydratase family protein [Chthonomonadales bacterium]